MKYLYFSAAWCAPCRILGPIMEEVKDEVPVEKIDVDTENELVDKFQIRNIPTVILVDEDLNQLKRFTGVQQKEFLINEFKNI